MRFNGWNKSFQWIDYRLSIPASPLPTFREKWEIWKGQNTGMRAAGRGEFRRRNGGIGAVVGVRRRVLRTQSVGAAEAEKIPAAADKSTSAAEKVAGEEKRRGQGPVPLESVRGG